MCHKNGQPSYYVRVYWTCCTLLILLFTFLDDFYKLIIEALKLFFWQYYIIFLFYLLQKIDFSKSLFLVLFDESNAQNHSAVALPKM